MNSTLPCPLCGVYDSANLADVMRHIRLVHADDPNFKINCTLQGCCRSFTNFLTFRNHMYAFHGTSSGSLMSEAAAIPVSQHPDDVTTTINEEDSDEEPHLSHSEAISAITRKEMKRAAAVWTLKIRDGYGLPQSTTECIIKDVDTLYQVALHNIRSDVYHKLQLADVIPESIDGLSNIFSDLGPNGALFPGLDTHHLQMDYYRKNFRFIEPEKIVLGTVRKAKGTGHKRRLVETEDAMMYIPLLETLELLLQNETILAEIQNGHRNTKGFMEDYCDGHHYKQHPLFSARVNALQIIFYYDDVEICNPLGSKKTVHKMGFFYYILGNISPVYRSKLSNIQLFAIAKTANIKKYSMNSILEPIIRDIKKLENGHTFTVHGKPCKLYGAIATICADNLGSNALGGFKEGSTAHRGCRHCMATPEEIKSKFNENDVELRSLDEHISQCDLLDSDPECSVEYGINFRSALMSLKYLNICEVLVPDVMHDILEGVIQYELKLLIRHCIAAGYFRASALETIMARFELGFMEASSRPSPISPKIIRSKDNSLKQNASQSWVLGRLFPAMMGHLIPADDKHWKNFLTLIQCMDILLAPRVTEDEVAFLQLLIEQHHKGFVKLYPDASVIPKIHYMIHMARLMLLFGPLVRQWTMRFEARHKYLKQLASKLGNFINIEYTLAMRHQQLQCYHHVNTTSISGEELEIGPSERISLSQLTNCTLATHLSANRSKWVRIHGTLYQKPCALIIDYTNDLPAFGALQNILIVNGRAYFHIRLFKTLHYSDHFHGYLVEPSTEYKTICHSDLACYTPIHIRFIGGLCKQRQKFLVLKHHFSSL